MIGFTRKYRITTIISIFLFATIFICAAPLQALSPITIYINGQQLAMDASSGQPVIIDGRTYVPLRAVSEGLGMEVGWDGVNRSVIITEPVTPDTTGKVSIMGTAQATSTQLRQYIQSKNPAAPDLADLYLRIGREYGIRGDIAFCQAAKETGYWMFTGDVKPIQNNYCGLWATGTANSGLEDLHGADASRVWFVGGTHGAYFDTPAAGVEAHIQHLYAYACDKPLPAGKKLVDPRFTLVNRGAAPYWQDLGGKWAPSSTYGSSILNDYYYKVNNISY